MKGFEIAGLRIHTSQISWENNTMKCAVAILKLMLPLYLGLLIIGCANYRMIDFTVISSKDTQLKIDTRAKGSRVEGTDTKWSFLFSFKRPDLKEAVDRAIEKAGPDYDALIDGVVYYRQDWYLVATKTTFKVFGTPIKTSALQANLQSSDSNILASQSVIYHSFHGISKDEALENLKIIKVNN